MDITKAKCGKDREIKLDFTLCKECCSSKEVLQADFTLNSFLRSHKFKFKYGKNYTKKLVFAIPGWLKYKYLKLSERIEQGIIGDNTPSVNSEGKFITHVKDGVIYDTIVCTHLNVNKSKTKIFTLLLSKGDIHGDIKNIGDKDGALKVLGCGVYGTVFKYTVYSLSSVIIKQQNQMYAYIKELSVYISLINKYKDLEKNNIASLLYYDVATLTLFMKEYKTVDINSKDFDPVIYGRGLAHGLHCMHSIGLAHRDLKLDNTMLTSDNKAVIIDFGISAFITRNIKYSSESVVQTFGYRAYELFKYGNQEFTHNPNVFNGGSITYDHTIDNWSLGILLNSTILKQASVQNWLRDKPYYIETLATVTNENFSNEGILYEIRFLEDNIEYSNYISYFVMFGFVNKEVTSITFEYFKDTLVIFPGLVNKYPEKRTKLHTLNTEDKEIRPEDIISNIGTYDKIYPLKVKLYKQKYLSTNRDAYIFSNYLICRFNIDPFIALNIALMIVNNAYDKINCHDCFQQSVITLDVTIAGTHLENLCENHNYFQYADVFNKIKNNLFNASLITYFSILYKESPFIKQYVKYSMYLHATNEEIEFDHAVYWIQSKVLEIKEVRNGYTPEQHALYGNRHKMPDNYNYDFMQSCHDYGRDIYYKCKK